MDFSDLIKLANAPLKKTAEPVNTIYASFQNIEELLNRLDNLENINDQYVETVVEAINTLKESFAAFKRSTKAGQGYSTLNKRLPQIKAWLGQYGSSIGEGEAKQLLSDFERIARIFDETLPATYEMYEQRVNDVLEYGNLFAKKANSFIINDEDVDLSDILTADDVGDAKEVLPEISTQGVPKKVLASMVSARKAYRQFFERVNAQMQQMKNSLDALEGIDFLDLMEKLNKRNILVKELVRHFSTLSKQLQTPDNPKIEFTEMFEPAMMEHYRALLRRAIKYLPQGMAEHLGRQMSMTRIKKIMDGSLETRRQEKKGDPEELMEKMRQNDKLRQASMLDPAEQMLLQASFARSLNKRAGFIGRVS